MGLLEKVFYKELLLSIVAVLVGFLILFMTIDALFDIGRIGQLDYTWKTLFIVAALKVPNYAYQILPICTLIGSVLALSNIAARSELIVWRASGLSLAHLVRLVLGIGVFLAIALYFLGNVGLSLAERHSKEVVNTALHRQQFFSDDGGYWSKQNLPGGGFRMINIKNVVDGNKLQHVSLYELNDQFTLEKIVEADNGLQKNKAGVWQLHNVRAVKMLSSGGGVYVKADDELEVDLGRNTLEVIRNYGQNTINFTMQQLNERIKTLRATGQNSREFEVAYWQKIMYPVGVLVMMLLALPFAFMQTRKGGVGVRVFAGIMLGLCFFMMTAMSQFLGGLVVWPPFILASTPSVLFLMIAVLWIHRVNRV